MSDFPGYNDLDDYQGAAVNWQYRLYGGFMTHIVNAISVADDGNLERMSAIFPIEVEAYKRYARVKGWWPETQKIAFRRGEEEDFNG